MFDPAAATLVITLLAFTGIWLIHVRLDDASFADYYWGLGFLLIALVSGGLAGFTPSSAILTLAVALWSLRLCLHLIVRHRKSLKEDGRYTAMRESGGPSFWWRSLFTIFLMQGVLLWVIAAPLHLVFRTSQHGELASPLFILGMTLFAIGFALEWAADQQLSRFCNFESNSGQVMMSGLWRLSRHPNYLGEIILWTGIAVAAYALTQSALVFVGPLVLILAMLFVSIPLTEAHLASSRENYLDYAQRTPKLLPSPYQLLVSTSQ